MAYQRGKHRGAVNINNGLDAFQKAYSITKGVMDDYAKSQVADTMKDGMAKSTAEAAASGGTDYTLDRGADDAATPDYSYKDKAARDSNAAEMETAASMQAEIDAETRGGVGRQPQAAAQSPTQAMQSAITPEPKAPQSATASMQAALNPASAQPGLQAVAPSGPTPSAPAYTQGEINKPQLNATDIFHKKYAAKVTEKLMQQGKTEDAMKFEEWSSSQQGKAYMRSWGEGMQRVNSGDLHGGIMAAQDLYNKQLPDGQYAVAVPGKDGDYTVEIRNEKTNKLLSSHTGKAQEIAAQAYGGLSPEQVYKISVEAPAAEAAQIRKEKRDVAGRIEVEQAKVKTESSSELAKMMKLRDSLPEGSPDRALAEKKIELLTTRQPPATTVIQMGQTPQEMAGGGQGVVVTDKGAKTSGLVPLKGAPNAVDEAYNALSGVTYAKPPGGVAKMYMRDGVPLSKTERDQAMKAHDVLRRNKRPAPWEQPGLK
jgi:hypothetical protein